MISFVHKGNFKRINKFLLFASKFNIKTKLDKYGMMGVEALASATPMNSGKTASSWSYEIEGDGGSASIVWTNNNMNEGIVIAVILHYGHGTGTGGYVEGRGYISPAIQPIFDQIANDAWKEVTNA